jgi:hypothetical protein
MFVKISCHCGSKPNVCDKAVDCNFHCSSHRVVLAIARYVLKKGCLKGE